MKVRRHGVTMIFPGPSIDGKGNCYIINSKGEVEEFHLSYSGVVALRLFLTVKRTSGKKKEESRIVVDPPINLCNEEE